jgi:hypothetical protein
MSDDEPNEQSPEDTEQSDQEPASETDQPVEQSTEDSDASEQSDEQAAEETDEPEQSDQPTDKSDETPVDESVQPTEQSDQVAEAEGNQTDQGDGGSTAASDDTVASAGGDAFPGGGGGGGTTAQPARGGSTRLAPRKRLFRFVVSVDNSAVPDFIKNVFSPDPTDYFFGYGVAGAADGDPAHMIEDSWERVPMDGIMDFPFNTVERKQFFIGVSVVPSSKVDPNAATSQPLHRIGSMHTDDFAPIKATDAATLVKKYPDGVFILQINLVAFYIQIVDAGATTYEAELSKAKIPLEDVVYNALSPFTDASGKVVGTKHDVVYWSTDLHLSGRKYVP